MNKHIIQIRPYFKSILEILLLVIIIFFLLRSDFGDYLHLSTIKVNDADHWLKCSLLEYQITRILGMNPGGFGETMQFFPFHKVSVFFSEPTWGISLAMVPLWLIKHNIFLLSSIMSILAILFSWVATYWFAKKLGCKRRYAFFAAMTFCLSDVAASLIMGRYFFWPFFLIPVLGCIIINIFKSDKFIWPVLFGIGLGYLAWASAHLFIMGGFFLFIFTFWKLWEDGFTKKKIVLIILAFFISALLSATLYIPMYLVHSKFSRPTVPEEQFAYATNLANLIYSSHYHPFHPLDKIPFFNTFKKHIKGELPIGISVAIFLLSMYYFLNSLFFSTPLKYSINFLSKIKTVPYYSLPIFLAVINIFIVKKFMSYGGVDILNTLLFYLIVGSLVIFFRHKLRAALHSLPFLFFVLSIIAAFFAFGPYYIKGGKAIPSPLISVLYFIPGFSGIRAVARWGIILSFSLSLGVSLSLSTFKSNLATKIFVNLLICLSLFELFRGINSYPIPFIKPYQWKPRQVDIFLKPLAYGAVLELESYPISSSGFKYLGYELYSALYHKKPVVTGNTALFPQVTIRYLYNDCETKLDCTRISEIRKFGVRYWIFHMDKWPKEDSFNPGKYLCGLKRIAVLDSGKTLVYEDPDPQTAITPFELI